jgi:hypothetical protein
MEKIRKKEEGRRKKGEGRRKLHLVLPSSFILPPF